MSSVHVAAVVVTYNRLSLLQENVNALRAQSSPPAEIIIINNGSTDGTAEWLAGQHDLCVVTQANSGGAGGFHTGLRTAYERGHDWFWCMDDDTIPRQDALERMTANVAFGEAGTGFLASVVLWTDGTPHRMNTPGTIQQTSWFHNVLETRALRASCASLVSLMVSRTAVERVGLPIKEFFIWYDDIEFTNRITQKFNGYFVLDSVAIHKTPFNAGPTFAKVEKKDHTKYLYGVRNRIITIRRSGNPAFARWLEIFRVFASVVKRAATGNGPIKGVIWALKGMTLRPRIDFPTADAARLPH